MEFDFYESEMDFCFQVLFGLRWYFCRNIKYLLENCSSNLVLAI
jgi:hypothetical protein